MTRQTETVGVKERYADRWNGYTGVKLDTYIDDLRIYTARKVVRSDVTRNPVREDGWRPPSPYSCTVSSADAGYLSISVSSGSGVNQRIWNSRSSWNVNTFGPFFDVTAEYVQSFQPSWNSQNQSLVLARNNVADRVASFGESLAELGKTAGMLASQAAAISKFADAVQKRDYRAMATSLGVRPRSRKARRAEHHLRQSGVPTLANAWLAYNFGIKPIISDMVSLAILLGEGKNLRVTGKGAIFTRKSDKKHVWSERTESFTGLKYAYGVSEEITAGVYSRLDYEVSMPALRQLTTYGLMDAPAVAWALVPYSFLVDFVLPVSEVLRSLTATFGLTYKGGCSTKFVRVKRKLDGAYALPTTSQKVITFDASMSPLEGFDMVRTVHSTNPNPVAIWIKDPIDAFKVSTVLAVLTQRLTHGLKPQYR